jgi:ribosomal protein S18
MLYADALSRPSDHLDNMSLDHLDVDVYRQAVAEYLKHAPKRLKGVTDMFASIL